MDEENEEHETEEHEPQAALEEEEAKESSLTSPLASPDSIPVTLNIELGHVEMSAEKLLSLSTGNLLELKASPDSPVGLVVNGKTIGKGELMMMGDQIGIRILELGK